MIKENDKKQEYSKYLIYAFLLAFVFAFFINITSKLLVLFFKVFIKYWFVFLVVGIIILFLRKKGGKNKNDNHNG